VRYWDHKAQADTVIAPSVRDFLSKLVERREDGPSLGLKSRSGK
jgi:hypothetical protein